MIMMLPSFVVACCFFNISLDRIIRHIIRLCLCNNIAQTTVICRDSLRYDYMFLKVAGGNLPITTKSYRIFEDEHNNILFRFRWDYDGETYTVPYQLSLIHI